jgi:hypothetical protein
MDDTLHDFDAFLHLDDRAREDGLSKYEILAPLLDEGLSRSTRGEIETRLCEEHGISPRTLRRHLHAYRQNNERFSGIPQSRVVLMKPEKRRVERARSGGSWGAMGISDGGGTWLRGFWWGDAVCGGGLYLGGSGLT